MCVFVQSFSDTKQSHIKLLFLQLLNEWNIAVNTIHKIYICVLAFRSSKFFDAALNSLNWTITTICLRILSKFVASKSVINEMNYENKIKKRSAYMKMLI